MVVNDILKGIEIWCTQVNDCSDYSCGFYRGSLKTLQAVGLISDDTYYKYIHMINDKLRGEQK